MPDWLDVPRPMLDLQEEIDRQDGIAEAAGYGYPFTRNGVRLGIAALEDELTEVREAWRADKNHLESGAWHLREELLQVAAVAVRIAREIPIDPQSADGWTPDTSQGFPPGAAWAIGRALVEAERTAVIPNRQEDG